MLAAVRLVEPLVINNGAQLVLLMAIGDGVRGAVVGKYGCKCAARIVLFWLTPLAHGLRSTVESGSRNGPVLQIACTMIIYPEEFPGPTCAPLTRRASIGMVSISIEGVVFVRVV